MLTLWVLNKPNIPEQDSATGIKHIGYYGRNEWEHFNVVNLSHSDPTSTRVYIPETWINISLKRKSTLTRLKEIKI